jgi:hypothetical protein
VNSAECRLLWEPPGNKGGGLEAPPSARLEGYPRSKVWGVEGVPPKGDLETPRDSAAGLGHAGLS